MYSFIYPARVKKEMFNFSTRRFSSIVIKEFLQTVRDKPTLGMMIGIPIMQLILFGFVINTNPKNIPTAVVVHDNSPITRQLLDGIANTEYFKLIRVKALPKAEKMLQNGDVGFIVVIEDKFTRKLIRKEHPNILLIADNTDPVTTSNALSALKSVTSSFSVTSQFAGALNYLSNEGQAIPITVHAKYNVLHKSHYNIVPGLLGVILTMTLAIVAALALSRERELGTIEFLLSTPARPMEIMLGKIVPFLMIGYFQIIIVLIAAKYLFSIPIFGSVFLILLVCFPFMVANLSIGLTFSTIAKNQLQAVQFAIFFFLPSLLLSGFMFPFSGMPNWAQVIGNILPLTHFVRIMRGIILKGQTLVDLFPELYPILLFSLVAIIVGLIRFKQTVD